MQEPGAVPERVCRAVAAGKGAGREVRQRRLKTLHTPFSPSVRPPTLSACSQALFGDRFSHPCSSIELFYFCIGNRYFCFRPRGDPVVTGGGWCGARARVRKATQLPGDACSPHCLHCAKTNKQAAAFTSRLSSQLFLNMVSFTKSGESLVFS